MKRMACVFVALVMLSSAVSAEGISFGVKAGLSTYNITEVPAGWDNTSFKSGFAGGVLLNYAFNENLSVQPEVLYVMKGLDGAISNPFVTIDFKGKYNYIDIPLLFKYAMPTESGFTPSLFVGPSLGINLTADFDIEGRDLIYDESITGSVDYSEVTNKVEFGIVIGAGCDYAVGSGQITFDARFNLGLSKVIKDGEVTGEINGEPYQDTVTEEDAKNIGFLLQLGYAF